MKKCNKCHLELKDESFPFRLTGDKTVRIGFCEDCNAKVKAYNKKYREDPESSKVLASAKSKWRHSEHGTNVTKEYRNSQLNKDAQAKYWKSSKGKVSVKRRLTKHRHSIDIQIGFSQLLSGARKKSSVVFRCTEFKTAEAVVAHVKSTLVNGMKWKDYGITWEVDHKIPRSSYDHDDPEDVLRCWSHANVRACCKTTNRSKNCQLCPELVQEVPTTYHPKSWLGIGSSVV